MKKTTTTPKKELPNKPTKEQESPKIYDLGSKLDRFAFFFDNKDKDPQGLLSAISDHIGKIIEKNKSEENYKILFLYHSATKLSIRDYTADQIYEAIPKQGDKQNILMFLVSSGGYIEPAYLLSRACKTYAKKFISVVPRKAKSAATLVALGSDEIHMGVMSQLGPIDPQIGHLPALGLINAVDYLTSLADKYPKAYRMLSHYLSNQLDLRILGHFGRVSESAAQYAERLLEGKKTPEGSSTKKIAEDLVYSYKDHGFVIDSEEAKRMLGNWVKSNTKEYELANELYEFLEDISWLISMIFKKDLAIEGDQISGISLYSQSED